MKKILQRTIGDRLCTVLVSSVCVVFLVTSVQAAFDMTSWQYSRSIETAGKIGMVKGVLPKEISWQKGDFSDLRIIDGDGVETPYVLGRSFGQGTYRSAEQVSGSMTILNKGVQGDGSTSFIVDSGQSGIVRTNMDLTSASPNYRRQVSVYASDTQLPISDSRWSLITSVAYIYKFTDPNTGYSAGKNTINFDAHTSRYFKVVIAGGPEGSVEIARVNVSNTKTYVQESYTEEKTARVYNNVEKKVTEITIDLGISGQLSHAVTLYPTDSNFSRIVTIQASDTDTASSTWNYVGQGSISHIKTPTFTGISDRISYPEQRSRFIRIVIINDDNPPLTFTQRASVEGSLITFVFEAQQGKSYRVYYGNTLARQPVYDITRITSYIDEQTVPIVTIGPEVVNASYVAPAGPVIPFSEAHPGLLNGFLVLVVLIIGGLILVYARTYLKKSTGQTKPGAYIDPKQIGDVAPQNSPATDVGGSDQFVGGK